MTATFVSNRLAELPAIMNGPQGRAWATGMGGVQDSQTAVLRVAALARLPFYCVDDALDACGTWLLLPRFPGEPNGTAPSSPGLTDGSGYRGRLCNAFPTWLKAGSKGAIIQSLNGYGLPNVEIQNDYETSGAWAGEWWSRFRVLINWPFGSYNWFTGNDPTTDQQNQIRQQILFWKWAYSYPVDVVITYENGDKFIFYIGPLIDYGLVIDEGTIGGFL